MMRRGLSTTRFYGQKQNDSSSSLNSTSSDDFMEASDIIIPETDRSFDGESDMDTMKESEEEERSLPYPLENDNPGVTLNDAPESTQRSSANTPSPVRNVDSCLLGRAPLQASKTVPDDPEENMTDGSCTVHEASQVPQKCAPDLGESTSSTETSSCLPVKKVQVKSKSNHLPPCKAVNKSTASTPNPGVTLNDAPESTQRSSANTPSPVGNVDSCLLGRAPLQASKTVPDDPEENMTDVSCTVHEASQVPQKCAPDLGESTSSRETSSCLPVKKVQVKSKSDHVPPCTAVENKSTASTPQMNGVLQERNVTNRKKRPALLSKSSTVSRKKLKPKEKENSPPASPATVSGPQEIEFSPQGINPENSNNNVLDEETSDDDVPLVKLKPGDNPLLLVNVTQRKKRPALSKSSTVSRKKLKPKEKENSSPASPATVSGPQETEFSPQGIDPDNSNYNVLDEESSDDDVPLVKLKPGDNPPSANTPSLVRNVDVDEGAPLLASEVNITQRKKLSKPVSVARKKGDKTSQEISPSASSTGSPSALKNDKRLFGLKGAPESIQRSSANTPSPVGNKDSCMLERSSAKAIVLNSTALTPKINRVLQETSVTHRKKQPELPQPVSVTVASKTINKENNPLACSPGTFPMEETNGTPLNERRVRQARKAKRALNYFEDCFEDPDNPSDQDSSDDDLLFSPEPPSNYNKRRNNRISRGAATNREVDGEEQNSVSASESSECNDASDNEESDNEGSDNEEIDEEVQSSKNARRGTEPTVPYKWCSEDIIEGNLRDESFDESHQPVKKHPLEYFQYYFDDEILQLIVNQTNIYSAQREENFELNMTVKELKVFIGIWIFMGICSLPCYHDYWTGATRVPLVAEAMKLSRFKLIRARLHFVDNSMETDASDAIRKVRPLVNHIQKKCKELKQCSNKFSIDESVIRYKGKKASNLRQYMKNKPHKWGFKAFVLTSSSGIAYDFLIYSGSKTFETEGVLEREGLGVGGNVVYHLCLSIQNPENSAICFDNYFTSLTLISILRSELGLFSIGTLRADRIKGCPVLSDKVLKKNGRGSCEVRSNEDNVGVVKWADNRCVLLAGSWAGIEPQSTVQRWDKKQRKFIDVNCPRIVQLYNSNMGGVDLLDMLISLYRLPSRAKRWPIPVVAFLIDLSLVNSYLCFKADQKTLYDDEPSKLEMGSKEFRLKVVGALLAEETKKRGRPTLQDIKAASKIIHSPVIPRPPEELRRNNGGHLPTHNEKKGRCKNCKDGFTSWKCSQCNVLLCLVPNRNCFTQFHIV